MSNEPLKTKITRIGGSVFAIIPAWYLKANELSYEDGEEVYLLLSKKKPRAEALHG